MYHVYVKFILSTFLSHQHPIIIIVRVKNLTDDSVVVFLYMNII